MCDNDSFAGCIIAILITGIVCAFIGAICSKNHQRKIYCNHKNMIYQEIDGKYYCQDKLKLYPIEWLQNSNEEK